MAIGDWDPPFVINLSRTKRKRKKKFATSLTGSHLIGSVPMTPDDMEMVRKLSGRVTTLLTDASAQLNSRLPRDAAILVELAAAMETTRRLEQLIEAGQGFFKSNNTTSSISSSSLSTPSRSPKS